MKNGSSFKPMKILIFEYKMIAARAASTITDISIAIST